MYFGVRWSLAPRPKPTPTRPDGFNTQTQELGDKENEKLEKMECINLVMIKYGDFWSTQDRLVNPYIFMESL